MLVTPAPIVAYIVCFTYLDSSTIKSQLPELVHSFTVGQDMEYFLSTYTNVVLTLAIIIRA